MLRKVPSTGSSSTSQVVLRLAASFVSAIPYRPAALPLRPPLLLRAGGVGRLERGRRRRALCRARPVHCELDTGSIPRDSSAGTLPSESKLRLHSVSDCHGNVNFP